MMFSLIISTYSLKVSTFSDTSGVDSVTPELFLSSCSCPALMVNSEGTRVNARRVVGRPWSALSPFCAPPPPGVDSKLWRCLQTHQIHHHGGGGLGRCCSTFMLNLLGPESVSDFRDNLSYLGHSTGDIRSHSSGNQIFCVCWLAMCPRLNWVFEPWQELSMMYHFNEIILRYLTGPQVLSWCRSAASNPPSWWWTHRKLRWTCHWHSAALTEHNVLPNSGMKSFLSMFAWLHCKGTSSTAIQNLKEAV